MSYARIGLGTAASDYIAQLAQQNAGDDGGYSDRAVSALNMIVSDPATQDALAPMVRTGVSIFKVAQQQWSAVSEASGGQMPQVLMGFVNDLTSTLAKSSQMVGDAIGAVGEAMPLIGTVVAMFTTAEGLIQQAHSAYMQNVVDCCVNNPDCGYGLNPGGFLPVTPSGAGKMMPADIFVAGWEGGAPAQTVTGPTGQVIVLKPAVPPNPIVPSLGQALIAVTEGSPGNIQWAKNFGANGIPADTRAKFKAMREAIQASAVHPELTDGGTKIWPVYLDLLRAEFDNGDLTVPYATYLWVLDGTGVAAGQPWLNAIAAAQGKYDLMSPYEVTGRADVQYTGYVECKKWDQRAFKALIQLVTNWRNIVLPKWGSDRAALSQQLATAQAAIQALAQAEALKRLGSGAMGFKITLPAGLVACVKAKGKWDVPHQTCTTTRAGVRWDTKTNTFVPVPLLVVKKSSPLLPILFGLAAVGSIAWMAKHRKKRATA